jgi:hypothetical protein
MNNCEEHGAAAGGIMDHLQQRGYPPTKKEFAYYASFDRLWQLSTCHYFWTITTDGYCCDEGFKLAWKRFLDRWRYLNGGDLPKGIRVFERFKSGFLHAHFVIGERVDVGFMRRVAGGTGIGRIHVRRAVTSDAHYLAKYLSKQRWRSGDGCRAWGKFGPWKHTRVRDVVVNSVSADIFRHCYHLECARVTPQSKRWVMAKVLAEKYYREWLESPFATFDAMIAAGAVPRN